MALLHIEESSPAPTGWPLLRLGFRPFYLLAACFALLAIPDWLLVYSGTLRTGSPLGGLAWHAHEMLFGYACAVITGFLLTAAPNWTGRDTPSGRPLAALALLWLLARLLLRFGPLWLAAPVDLMFLPVVAWCLHRVLRHGKNRRNDFVPRLLLGLWLLNLTFYLASQGWLPLSPLLPLEATLYLVTLLEVIIAGRVVAMFTRNAIPGIRQYRLEWLERWIAPLTLAVLLADLAPLPGWALVAPNLALAVLHGMRWWGWNPLATAGKPLLWILHLSYLWIIIGFALAAGASGGLLPWIAVIHVFAIGGAGGLTLGMLTRTALGHSGRMLVAGKIETLAYCAMMLAAVLRVAPLLFNLPGYYFSCLYAAGACWSTAFVLYLMKYTTILMKIRADGKPG